MPTSLQGTVALVTGASSGIGEATAAALAAHGANVAIAARRRDRLEALAGRIAADGGAALVLEADVTDPEQARGIVEDTVSALGRLDVLVNNAGVMLLGPIVGADPDEWDLMLDLNVRALMHVTNAALPHLLQAAEGDPRRVADLVNVSSVAGRLARAGSGGYNASKWAVNAFSESLRQEITKRFVRIALIEPGFVATELQSHNRPEIQAQIQTLVEPGLGMQAQDIADAIVYVVTRPRHVAINEVLIRPTVQDR
ncbi:MAG TPA: SDR family NAD(P)-dependent oxidoreductase [Candidatus Sulfotelmatobacter sp.]|nr:SDR family NAD(P)-dependent oxidoreductase [Candidatus Sulfotelmatobacter sp.]